MEVFHHLAIVLKDVDIFDAQPMDLANDENSGAIYNDFDSNPLDLLGGISDAPCYSQSSNLQKKVVPENEDVAPKEAIEYALLEGDKNESIFVDFLTFPTDLYDISTSEPDLDYMAKVHRIATVENESDFEEDMDITEDVINVYKMRYRNNWHGTDSIYDAWLLVQGYKRKWFPYSRFHRKYPKARESILAKRRKYRDMDFHNETATEEEESTAKKSDNETLLSQPKKYLTKKGIEQFFNDEKVTDFRHDKV